jgi:hypothetical protein
MADKERNTINPDTIKVGYAVAKGYSVARHFDMMAVGQDTEKGRFFVQIRQLVPVQVNDQTHLKVSFDEQPNLGLYYTQEAIKGIVDEYVRWRDDASSLNRSDFLAGVYAGITPDLEIVLDEKRTGLWQVYSQDKFSTLRVFTGKPAMMELIDDLNFKRVRGSALYQRPAVGSKRITSSGIDIDAEGNASQPQRDYLRWNEMGR